MAEEYILVRDIIHDHNARMLNIKKYYPYFKLADMDFSSFQGGIYSCLDMGYILMAVLRFFIEENNFKEKDVSYNEYELFMHEIYRRDFELALLPEEEKAISAYIFDKIRNDGRPFSYNYFDPNEKTKKTIRMRVIDSRMKDDEIKYHITSDAIEFYLDTKEIKDESSISIAQVLLEKMITSKNFKGGTDVIKRINNEVGRLKMRKNEVLTMLSYDIFEGMKAYKDFVNTGIKWFDEEQKLFAKNMELVEEARKRAQSDEFANETFKDIFELETELKKAIVKHSELLNACTQLQVKADEIISGAKLSRIRRKFDFNDALKVAMERDNASVLEYLIKPMLKLNINKSFSMVSIDKMLSLLPEKEEKGEKINENTSEEMYVYEDEVEQLRIDDNYKTLIIELLNFLLKRTSFDLREFNEYLVNKYTQSILKNGDYYSMLIHMCQKKIYDIGLVMEKPDTFFEKHICDALKDEKDEALFDICFEVETTQDDMIQQEGIFEISNIQWRLI